MKYEWDERKRRANVRKHAIDFQDAIAIFESDIVTMEDGRFAMEKCDTSPWVS